MTDPDTHAAGHVAPLERELQRASLIFHASPDAIAILRLADERFQEVNDRFVERVGLTRDHVIGRTMSELGIWPDQLGRAQVLKRLTLDREIHGVETRFRLSDGSTLDVLLSAKIVEIDGETCVLAIISDITQLKSSEKRIERLSRLYAVLSAVNEAVVHLGQPRAILEETCRVIVEDGGFAMARVGLIEPDGAHVRCVAQSTLGEAVGEFHITMDGDAHVTSPVALAISNNRREVIQDIAHDAKDAPWREAALQHGHRSTAAFPLSLNGRLIGALNIAAAEPDFFDEQHIELLDQLAGDISFALGLAEEQEERARAEARLRLSEDKFSTAFRTSPDSVNINRLSDGLFIETNLGFTELTGYTEEDVRGKTSLEISVWADDADRERLVAGLRARGLVNNLEARFRRKDGSLTTALMSARLIEVDSEPCILSITRDISERKLAEEQHREILATAMDGFWLCDASGQIKEVNEAYCQMSGYTEAELLTMNISDLEVFETCPDAVAAHAAHIAESGHDRFETRHRRKDGTAFDVESSVRYQHGSGLFSAFQRDITERKHAEELLASSFSSLIDVVSRVVESRDAYTAGHQRRVAELSEALATRLGMAPEAVQEIRNAALVHDIGKMSVPAEILSKPGALLSVEFDLIKTHAEAGYQILKSADMPGLLPEIVHQHHERCDGSGYPQGLTGEQLLPATKIVMVADVVEAMVSHRPYRPAMGLEAALAEIESGAGTRYSREVSDACLSLFRSEGFAFDEV